MVILLLSLEIYIVSLVEKLISGGFYL